MLGVSKKVPYSTDQLRALQQLQELGKAISENNKRLSTLKRINSAKDDPKGLVHASELQQDITAADAAADAIGLARAQMNTADSAAAEVIAQLNAARTLALDAASGSLSHADVVANQIEVDHILNSINETAKVSFGDKRMLDGSASYRATGVDNSKIKDVDILGKASDDAVTLSINVTSTAQQATDSYTGGTLMSDTTIQITGPEGAAAVTMSSGSTTTDIATAINAATYLTGINATMVDGTQVDFATNDYGSDASISIVATEGTFATTAGTTVTGTDAEATINGQTVTADGTTLSYSTADVSVVIELDPTASGSIAPITISGDGLKFVIGMASYDTHRLGMPNLTTTSLGGSTGNLDAIRSGGQFSLSSGNATYAINIIDEALDEAIRGQAVIGSFQTYTLDSASRMMSSMIENLSSALSAIEDTDYALESAKLANNLLLRESTLSALAIANSQDQAVLGLLQSIAY